MNKDENLSKRILNYPVCKKDKEVIESLFFSYSERLPDDFDVILVLGGKNLNRIHTALKIYFKRPRMMILSGGVKSNKNIKECYRYLEYAIKHGVDRNNIICESKSKNTYQNILYSFGLLKKMNLLDSRILIVSSNFHIPRVRFIVNKIKKKYFFNYTCFYFPSSARHYSSNSWFLYPTIRKTLSQEIAKLGYYS